jgi:hypothetical protein
MLITLTEKRSFYCDKGKKIKTDVETNEDC